jgi:hypothetical protein
MNKGIPIKEAMELYPEVKELVGKLERGEISACACMGPMYGEPHCYCTMERLGLPLSPLREEANKRANERLDALFGPGGMYHKEAPK